jgi:glycosyltransferase involved in cell wall biosynthesis
LDHTALVRELECAHLAVLPSHAESFGLAVAEAQAAGLPVIACAVGAVPEVVENNVTGWLIPPGRDDLLAGAIVEAMGRPDRAYEMGLAGRERINRLFSWPSSAAAMLEHLAATGDHAVRLRVPITSGNRE